MGDGINLDPAVVKSVRENLTKSHEAAQQLATSLESYAQTLPTCWSDESTNEVVELIREGKLMYETTAGKIQQVLNRLNETEKLLAQQAAQQAAREQAAMDAAIANTPVMEMPTPWKGVPTIKA